MTLTPTPTSTSTPTPEPTPVFRLYNIFKPTKLDSFQAIEIEKWKGKDSDGDESSKKRKIEYSLGKQPYLLNAKISGDFVDLEQFGPSVGLFQGLAGLLGGFGGGTAKNPEMYLAENEVYFRQTAGWMKISLDTASLGDTFSILFTPNIDTNAPEALEWLKKVNYVGKEKYNDVDTWRYSFDQTCIDETNLPDDMSIEEATGNLYASAGEPLHLIHLDVTLNGSNLRVEETIKPPLESGSLEYSIDFTDINQTTPELPVTLQEFGDMPEDLPIYEDASQPLTMDMKVMDKVMKVHAFQTAASANKVLSFYKTAMPKNGWKLETQTSASGNYTLVFNKEDRQVTLQIQPLASSQMTQFIFMIALSS